MAIQSFPWMCITLYTIIKHPKLGTGKIAQWVKTLITKPDDLRSMLRTHMVEEHNWLSTGCTFTPTYASWLMKMHKHIIIFVLSKLKPDVVAHPCNPSTFRVESRRIRSSRTSLQCASSLRPAWATWNFIHDSHPLKKWKDKILGIELDTVFWAKSYCSGQSNPENMYRINSNMIEIFLL